MKVAMIGLKGLPATYGGVERHVEELSAALVARGHEVVAYSRRYYTAAGVRSHRGVRIVRLPSIPTKHWDAITHSLLATAAAIIRGNDVIHFHGAGPAFFAPLSRAAGKRTVVTIHAPDWMRSKWGPVARVALRAGAANARFADAVIVVSHQLQKLMRRLYGVNAEVIPNAVTVPPRMVALDLLRRRFGLEEGRFVLFLGRFVPEKGCDLLIRAFREMKTTMRLVMAGDIRAGGGYFEKLRALAGQDERIIFPGGLYGREKEEALAHAAVFVLPSRVEGMAIGLLEALAWGCPVLVSDIPENREVIAAAGAPLAVTFRDGDVLDLRRQLEALLSAPIAARARAARAAAHVRHHYNWGDVAARTEAVYRRCFAHRV